MQPLLVERLRAGESLAALAEQYGLVLSYAADAPLVIANYSQIASPRFDALPRGCRGLTLELDTWKVVARSFDRFFNFGECPAEDAAFDWTDFICQEKVDGSLILLYHYDGDWRVNTRGSFGQGTIVPGGPTWAEAVWALICDGLGDISKEWTYVFELCTPWNKVVRSYPEQRLYLLTAVETATGRELDYEMVRQTAELLGVYRPNLYHVRGPEHIQALLADEPDATWEGYVVRDRFDRRLKLKNPAYVALHHMRGEGGNLFLPKYLLPFILKGETDEVLSYFPEVAERVAELKAVAEETWARFVGAWVGCRGAATRKEFARRALEHGSLSSLLFLALKDDDPERVWREQAFEYLMKRLKREEACAAI